MARKIGTMLFYGAVNVNYPFAQTGVGVGQFALTRTGLGNISINGPGTAAAGTLNAWLGLADIKRPFISFPYYPGAGPNFVPVSNELQEVFGTAAGGPGNPLGPGFSGTPAIPWGVAIIDFFAVYAVVTTALTSATLGLTRATYTENVAFTNTTVLAAAAIATTVTASATAPHVQTVALPQPLAFETANFSDLTVEFSATTGATINSLLLFGIGLHAVYCLE